MKNLVLLIIFLLLISSNCLLNAQWVQTNVPENANIFALAINGSNIFAGGDSMFVSKNKGLDWIAANKGLTTMGVWSLAVKENEIFVGTGSGGIFRSSDTASTWIPINGLPSLLYVLSLGVNGSNIFAGTNFGLYLSNDNCANWVTLNLPDPAYCIAFNGINTFAGTPNDGIYFSSNNGQDWIQENNGLTCLSIYSILVNENNIFAATNGGGIFLSTNNGDTWRPINNGLVDTVICSLASKGSNIFASSQSGLVYLSTNNGLNWKQISEGLPNKKIWSLLCNDEYIFAGTKLKGLWRRPLSEVIPVELISFNAAANGGFVNLSWKTATEVNNKGFEIQRKSPIGNFNTIDFVNGHGTTSKTNNYSWSEILQPGNYSYRLKQLDYDGKFEYSKEVEVTIAPQTFSLEQNYPNPFNPTTTISYSLPKASNVKLIVYNTLGQEIKTLVSEYKAAGNYTINFNASALPSGIYFYKLEADSFTQIKKMILLK